MAREFVLQDPGEGIHEVEILEVHVSPGDDVEEGEVILTVETDKATMDVPSPFSGTVEEIEIDEGDVARVGEVLMTYRPASGAEEGQGPEPSEGAEEEDRETDGEAPPHRVGEPVPAAPATRRLAREQGVDLRQVEGSGPGGRVTRGDVKRAAGGEAEKAKRKPEDDQETARPRRRALDGGTVPLPDFDRWGEVERLPLRSVRRTIAERMSSAWSEIPHVMHQDTADITDLELMRREQRQGLAEDDGELTLTVLVMKVAAGALREFPRFNASLDQEAGEIVLKHFCHIGVAVDTERGLIVPVVRDVDRKSVAELARELPELVERTRSGDVERADLQGGTFTITNPGPIGGTSLTPLINPPQVAILGLGRADLVPVVRGTLDEHELTARLRLPLCLSFDHRVNDGADAARFVGWIAERLSSPDEFLLSV